MADLAANTNARTVNLPTARESTGSIAHDGFIYYNSANSNTIRKVRASDGVQVASGAIAGAGFQNQSHWLWGGYRDISLYFDSDGTM